MVEFRWPREQPSTWIRSLNLRDDQSQLTCNDLLDNIGSQWRSPPLPICRLPGRERVPWMSASSMVLSLDRATFSNIL
jgi:hypothetical protein